MLTGLNYTIAVIGLLVLRLNCLECVGVVRVKIYGWLLGDVVVILHCV